MKNDPADDTIAAIATGTGSAAIGIVRVSGSSAMAILKQIVPIRSLIDKPRRMMAGRAVHPKTRQHLDEVMCFWAPGPKTATGQEVAELHGHGGPVVLHQLLDAVLTAGARPAEPGEFTYRAFLNGRIDLTQAQAVMELIGAQSERAARVALRTLEGEIGSRIGAELNELANVSAHVEAGLDFPDEDLPLSEVRGLANRIDEVVARLDLLCNTFDLGIRLHDGAKIAIVGPPNAGKSSLLNRLVDEDRAIVDETPGTTRDIVEARGEADGIPLVFLDTAGLRSNPERIEQRGIERAIEAAKQADLLVIVLDGTEVTTSLNGETFDLLIKSRPPSTIIVSANKKDLSNFALPGTPWQSWPIIPISARTGDGIEQLKSQIAKLLSNDVGDETLVITDARQHTAIRESITNLSRASDVLNTGSDPELAAVDLRFAREHLSKILGRDANADILDEIFSSFCLGK